MRRPFLVGLVLLALTSVFTSCSDESPGDSDERVVSQPSGSPTVPAATPFPEPNTSGRTVVYEAKGYSVDVPDGWVFTPNVVFDSVNARYPTDALFDAKAPGDVRPNVSFVCLKAEPVTTVAEAARAWGEHLRALLGREVPGQPLQIGGMEAVSFEYSQKLRENTASAMSQAVHKIDVLTVNQGCRWLITLTVPQAPSEDLVRYKTILDQVLSSLKFLN